MSGPPGPVPGDQAVTLARIEIKLDQALRVGDDHESRIRAIESRNWPKQSVQIVLATISSAAAFFALLAPALR